MRAPQPPAAGGPKRPARQVERVHKEPVDEILSIGSPEAADEPGPIEYVEEAPVRLSERRRERDAERRRIVAKRVGIGVGALAGLIFIGWLVLFSALFGVNLANVEVRGIEGTPLTREQVVAQMTDVEGQSLALVNTGAAAEKIRDIPMVKAVSVDRAWPRGLTVTVTPREPIACVAEGETCVAIDADGVRLDLPAESVSTLPHIQLSDGDGDAGLASKNLQTIFSALDEGTRGQIITISVDKNQQFTLTLANSVQIFWGTSDDSVFKAEVLQVLLAQQVTFIDVSSPTSPVTQ